MLQTFSRFSKKCSHANIKYTAPAVIRAFSSSQRHQIPDKFKLIANEAVLQYFKDNNQLISQIEVLHTENYLKRVKSCRYDQFRKILLTNALTKMENGEEHALEKSVNEYVEKVTENTIQFYKDWIVKVQTEWQQSEHYNGQMTTRYPLLLWECVFCYEINESWTSVFQSWRDPKEFSAKVMECECLITDSYTYTANDFVSYEVCKNVLSYAWNIPREVFQFGISKNMGLRQLF